MSLNAGQYRKMILKLLTRPPVAFHASFAHLTGSVTAALLLSQLLYWSDKGREADGWIYKTADELTDETGLSRHEQETARRVLRDLGLLEERRRGMPAKLHFRIDFERFLELLAGPDQFRGIRESRMADSANQDARIVPIKSREKRETRIADSANQDAPDPPNMSRAKRQTITKTTAETTQEITQLEEIWTQVLGQLEQQMTAANYRTWLQDTRAVGRRGATLMVRAPNDHVQAWLETRFRLLVQRALRAVAGDLEEVQFEVG